MLSLPEPQPNGSLELLRRFVEVDDQSFVLYVSWLVGALAPVRRQGAARAVHCSRGGRRTGQRKDYRVPHGSQFGRSE